MNKSDWEHRAGASREQVIDERCASWVATADGATHMCLRRCLAGNVLWTLWECTTSGGTRRYIGCDVLEANRIGWSFRSLREANGLTHVNCPPPFLEEAAVVSASWREAVRAYWRGEAEPLIPRATQRTDGQLFAVGERVRLRSQADGTISADSLGTVAHVPDVSPATVHADMLRRTTFVQWDEHPAQAVFSVNLERC